MISNTKLFLVVLSISFLALPLNAQENDSLYYFAGQILSEGGNTPVSFAHIINRNRRWGASADTLGFFHIWAKPGDSLHVSAIGFYYLQYEVNKVNSDSVAQIHLAPRFYDIPEASIYFLGTYKEFEYKVLNLELPESKINPQIEKILKHVETPTFIEPKITSPASLIYVLFSKEAKDINKYIELSKETKVLDKVRLKYNREIVSNLTGLSEEEANELMKFCDFDNRYILSIESYKLFSEILLRYEAFKKSKEDSLKKE